MVPHLRQRFSRCSSLLVPWALLIFSSKCFTVIEVKTWLIGTGLVITIYTTLFICTTIISTTHRQMRSHKEPCLIHLCYMLWGKTTLSFLCKNNPNISLAKLQCCRKRLYEGFFKHCVKGVGGPLDISKWNMKCKNWILQRAKWSRRSFWQILLKRRKDLVDLEIDARNVTIHYSQIIFAFASSFFFSFFLSARFAILQFLS